VNNFHQLSYVGDYIRGFGLLAPAVALLLFSVQSAVPVFPYGVLVAAAVIVFGGKIGFLLAMLGALLGSSLCYWTCRELGADWFNRKILRHWGYDTNNINHSMASWGIVVAHMIPFLPSAMINMAAAISRVSFLRFVLSTVVGFIPLTLAYTGIGMFIFYIQDIPLAIVVLALLMILMLGLKQIVQERLQIGNPLLEQQPRADRQERPATGMDSN
jgi:uncharacterized membrane protein YdjX (TVP38/TMEM64 family)